MIRGHAVLPLGSVLDGVTVSYLVDKAEARLRLGGMVRAGGPVAVDIETAPHKAEVDRLANLAKAKEIASGNLRALKKLKASADRGRGACRRGKAARGRNQVRQGRRSRPPTRPHPAPASLRRRRSRSRHRSGPHRRRRSRPARWRERHRPQRSLRNVLHRDGGRALGLRPMHVAGLQVALGEHATSLADGAEAYLDLKLDKTEQKSDWTRRPDQAAN